MGDLVNRTTDIAVEWQRHIVRIRINLGYIIAELPHLTDSGKDVSDIKTLVNSFGSAFEKFYRKELEIFIAARKAEIDDEGKNELVNRLHLLKGSFNSCLRDYNNVVEARRTDKPSVLALLLLTSCGAKLKNSFSRFVDVIDAYIDEIE